MYEDLNLKNQTVIETKERNKKKKYDKKILKKSNKEMENNEMYVGLSHCSYNLLIARSIQLENGGSLTECENFTGS